MNSAKIFVVTAALVLGLGLATARADSDIKAPAAPSQPAVGDIGSGATHEAGADEEYASSVQTLTQLGSGVLRYLRARGQFPVMTNPLDWKTRRTFYPYVADERLFVHPETEVPYRWNEILSGKKPVHIINPQSFAVFYETTPATDGRRAVLFLDGHVERVIPAHWQRIARASKIELGAAQ